MIAGNARLMAEIPEMPDEPLTPELLLRFHAIGMQGILLNIMLATSGRLYTAADVSEALGISDNTARSDLRALVREALAEEMPANDHKKIHRIAKKFN